MAKVLVLNGSPRRGGTVETMLRGVVDGLGGAAEVQWVDVCKLELAHCIACMKCRPDGVCVLPQDDAHDVAEMLGGCDGLVIGTPTHWGNMSSPLKTLFDRMVPALIGEQKSGLPLPRHKGKPAIVLTACTTQWPFNFILAQSRGALRAMGGILHYAGFRSVARLAAPGTKGKSQISPKALQKAEAAGRRMAGRLKLG